MHCVTSGRVPDVVIRRMVTYLRVLREIPRGTKEYISSSAMGDLAAVNDAQVRKDLALFGEFGKQGVGYPVLGLTEELVRILGADCDMPVAIFGVGELGTALVRYITGRRRNDAEYPFVITALFDSDPRKIGKEIEGNEIESPDSWKDAENRRDIRIALITVPAYAAQEAADRAMSFGIKGFLNFAPTKLKMPTGVRVVNADVTLQLQELAYHL